MGRYATERSYRPILEEFETVSDKLFEFNWNLIQLNCTLINIKCNSCNFSQFSTTNRDNFLGLYYLTNLNSCFNNG